MTYITQRTVRKIMFSSRILTILLAGVVLVVLQSSTVQAQQWTTTSTNISNTNTGNVGVGTTTSTPTERLTVLVSDAVSNGVTQVLSIGHTTTGTPSAGLGSGFTFRAKRSDGSMGNIGHIAGVWEDPTNGTEDGALVFAPTLNSTGFGTERMRISSSGNVGIGTTSPNRKLDVLDTSNPQLRLTHTAGSAYTDFQVVGTGQLVISPSGVDISIIKPISVAATSDAVRFYYSSEDSKRWGIGTGAGGLFHIFQRGDSWADEGARLTINRVGNVGIGTTTPTERLHVSGNGKFTGNLTVDGTINAKYQDVAEWVPSTEQLAAGTVVVLDQTKSNQVIASSQAYDTRVAGVISLQPGITLGENGAGKVLVATTGRVRIRVDASRGSIQIGDLLVTSDMPGVAMKSQPIDIGGAQIHRPGTLIGKALEPLTNGSGEILVLLSLQ